MILPPERIAAACDMSPVEGIALLGRARAGNKNALADWLAFAVMSKMRHSSPSAAVAKVRTIRIMAAVDVVSGARDV